MEIKPETERITYSVVKVSVDLMKYLPHLLPAERQVEFMQQIFELQPTGKY
jgi:hypothetical protein